jgi:exosortase A
MAGRLGQGNMADRLANLRAQLSALLDDDDAKRWLSDAAVLLLSIAALSAVFWREASGAVTVWIQSPTFNHCFLILPISLFIMWTRRDGVSELPQKPRLRAALLLLPLSLMWLTASVASVLEAQQFVAVTMLQVTLLATLGWPVYRRYMAAFLYLYFLVPSGAELVPSLQQLTAHLAVAGLKLIGIPVYSNGAVIEIPAGTFAVAEACAGLRFLVATVAFGVFYATQIYTGIWRRLAFIALCVVVPILANGMRVFGIIAAAQWLGSPTAAVADHLIYGWGFFSLVLLILVFVGRRFADFEDTARVPAASGPLRPLLWPSLGAGALCAVLAASFPVLSIFLSRSSDDALPVAPPSVARTWQPVADDGFWKPVVTSPARAFSGAYSNGADTVYSFLALYPGRGRTNNLVRSNDRIADEEAWKLNATSKRTLRIEGRDTAVNETTITGGQRKLTVWSFYVVGGNVETSVWAVKLKQLENYFDGESCTSAFVAIAAAGAGDQPANPDLATRYLSATTPLRRYLCATGHAG